MKRVWTQQLHQQQIKIMLYCILTVFQLILTTVLILKIVTFDLYNSNFNHANRGYRIK